MANILEDILRKEDRETGTSIPSIPRKRRWRTTEAALFDYYCSSILE